MSYDVEKPSPKPKTRGEISALKVEEYAVAAGTDPTLIREAIQAAMDEGRAEAHAHAVEFLLSRYHELHKGLRENAARRVWEAAVALRCSLSGEPEGVADARLRAVYLGAWCGER